MKEIFFGIFAGVITSLGMGGGALLILLLNYFTDLNQHLIQGANLIFFIPTSIVSTISNYKNNKIDWKIIKAVGISGIIGAVIGSKTSQNINSNNLKKHFGYFLLLIAILEIYEFFKLYINNKKDNNNNKEKMKGEK